MAVGSVEREGDRVQCHLCERWFKSVTAHLSSHGWDHIAYREAFGLERGASLEGDATRKRRAALMRKRRVLDPAIREGVDRGIDMARSGLLAKAAAEAARGRPQPEQRRRKTLRTLAEIGPEARAEGRRRQGTEQLKRTAAEAAARLGYGSIGALVRDRVEAGASLAAISREAGLHKDWLTRKLAIVDGEAADFATRADRRWDTPWLPVLAELGFSDVADYLTDRHIVRHETVWAIAAETGFSRKTVESALARHGLARRPHVRKRNALRQRADAIADRFGFADIAAYLAHRRAAGWSWQAIAAEADQPQTWIRRRAREAGL
ncbi:hypothetical protein DMH04_37335 [Kibdelosporangium aridum]|uniref:ROS/MUCR transcriptional regulator protein n=1 Tax=Kibdelosporangium aridum TaxID=2030 RepID=A0A428YZ82_KIBAR|nr:MucR family transcriptional regulator [Kibdelosporangium aridum]RSM75971.1 hypothetical protein DMH04_37335 [Kibdelosporangium aridum]